MARGSQLESPWAPPGWAAVLPGDTSVYFLPERCGVSPSPGKIWLSRWIWLLGPTGLSSRPSGVTVSWTHCSFWTIFPLLTHWKPSSLEGRWAFARCLAGTKAILHGAWEVILVPMQALQMPQTVFANLGSWNQCSHSKGSGLDLWSGMDR